MPSGNAMATASSRAREARRGQENGLDGRRESSVVTMGILMIGRGKYLLLPLWAA